jgi:hypothetical protein
MEKDKEITAIVIVFFLKVKFLTTFLENGKSKPL